MLQKIRDKSQGWFASVVVGLIALTFIVIGTGSYLDNEAKVVAKVNGIEISQQDIEQNYERLLLRQDPEQGDIDTQVLKKSALETLIHEVALKTASQERGFIISPSQVIREISSDPVFQENGRFSPDRYSLLISQHYFSDQQYRSYLENQIMNAQLEKGLLLTNFILPEDLKTYYKFQNQERSIQYVVIPKAAFIPNIKVSDEDAKAYYEAHNSEFMTEETVKLAYIDAQVDSIKEHLVSNEETLKQYYQNNLQLFSDPEKVRVGHILINIDSADNGRAKALETIRVIQAKLKEGVTFAELAKEYSADSISAKKGGEVSWLTQGEPYLSKAFEDASFKLKTKGEVSEPVLTEFGYHLIQLIERKNALVRSYDKVQQQVKEQYINQTAEETLHEIADQMVTLAFEYSDSLETVADKLKLPIKTTGLVTRDGGADDFSRQPAVIKAAFSEQVLNDENNSDLLELSDNHYAVLRVIERKRPELKAFNIVKADIVSQLTGAQATAQAKARAQDIVKSIELKKSLTDVAKSQTFTWKSATFKRNEMSVPGEVATKAFELPRYTEKALDIVTLDSGDEAVVVLLKVKDGSLDSLSSKELDMTREYFAMNKGLAEYMMFVKEAINSATIKK